MPYQIRYRTNRGDVRQIGFHSLLTAWDFAADIRRTLRLRPTQIAIRGPQGRFLPHAPF